jgi:hypothetical protein
LDFVLMCGNCLLPRLARWALLWPTSGHQTALICCMFELASSCVFCAPLGLGLH